MKVHQIKIDFNVTEQIKRFVYVYILEAESLYLIDSGVYGSEIKIIDFLDTIGRNISEIRGIFLTHAHPDHIGSAAWFQEHTGCKIYASEGEKIGLRISICSFQKDPFQISIILQENHQRLMSWLRTEMRFNWTVVW
ncbi:MAG: MBL fold metallo-hydrolase [Oribacterium sp.]|nr:MBL fold metallo-hydrolase [Oribacterium sp.]